MDVLYGQLLPGGPQEIVIHSEASESRVEFAPPQQYVDAFGWSEAGGWERIFAATEYLDDGRPILATEEFVSEIVDYLQLVDFRDNGQDQLVLGIQSFGASTGPFDLRILEFAPGSVRVALHTGGDRGGAVEREGRNLVMDTAVYLPEDAGCCPSRSSTSLIGHNPETGRIEVLEYQEFPFEAG